ncbi:hypothetical protein HYPSUDRAFT_206699 [Hypholoma sublateritium FD-334 SS-4]|uniref:Uncharacterized protein n=1 Tax=Hypholoma sublateritium (strain FD-334 SS-4) TaxID=945553 RepID=A0A0D2KQK6_HYPSF|nr:hypothetical protein HYPSUDRAFT_206699 [Hypholoma sublateritium FD-334 SS-4]
MHGHRGRLAPVDFVDGLHGQSRTPAIDRAFKCSDKPLSTLRPLLAGSFSSLDAPTAWLAAERMVRCTLAFAPPPPHNSIGRAPRAAGWWYPASRRVIAHRPPPAFRCRRRRARLLSASHWTPRTGAVLTSGPAPVCALLPPPPPRPVSSLLLGLNAPPAMRCAPRGRSPPVAAPLAGASRFVPVKCPAVWNVPGPRRCYARPAASTANQRTRVTPEDHPPREAVGVHEANKG